MKIWWNLSTSNYLCSSFLKCRLAYSASKSSPTLKRLKNIRDITDSYFMDIDSSKYWSLSTNGKFTTKSAWEAIRKVITSSFLFSYIWNPAIPHKISIFLWKCMHSIIPLEDQLQLKGIKIASICRCCYNQSESFNHLFIGGTLAKSIWSFFASLFSIKISYSSFHQLLMSWWLKKSSKDFIKYLLILVPATIFWEIWRSRNKCVFENERMDASKIIKNVINLISSVSSQHQFKSSFLYYEEIQSLLSLKSKTYTCSFHIVKWSAPKEPYFKLNCDGASKGNPGKSGSGGIIRNYKGQLIQAFASFEGFISNNRSECLAILKGLQICKNLNINHIIVESDSKMVIDILTGKILKTP